MFGSLRLSWSPSVSCSSHRRSQDCKIAKIPNTLLGPASLRAFVGLESHNIHQYPKAKDYLRLLILL